MAKFEASHLKIQRAKKHINDLDSLLVHFINSDFYTLAVEKDVERGINHLRVDYDLSNFPSKIIALVIGDALPNLRSALDLLYYATVLECGGVPTKWTRFPVRDTRDALIAPLTGALEKQQINAKVSEVILDVVKPYETGNYALWALDDLNIRDKHQLLVPVFQLMRFGGIRLEDDQHRPFAWREWIVLGGPNRVRIQQSEGINLTVKDKGHAAGTIAFEFGVPFEGKQVIPTLLRIAEDVTRTLEAFEPLFFG